MQSFETTKKFTIVVLGKEYLVFEYRIYQNTPLEDCYYSCHDSKFGIVNVQYREELNGWAVWEKLKITELSAAIGAAIEQHLKTP